MLEKIFGHRRFSLFASLAIAGAILLVYSNTFTASFHFDDGHTILDNHKIRGLKHFNALINSPRPVSYITFAINYMFGGYNVLGYHIINIAIHIGVSVMAFFLLIRTFAFLNKEEVWSRRVSFFTALLFALHPIQTQSVTYIVQRMETLSAFFMVAAMLLFIRGVVTTSRVGAVLLYSSVLVFYFLGFHSKEVAVTLPAIIILYDIYFVSKGSLKGLVPRSPFYFFLGAMLAYFVIATVAPGGLGGRSVGVTTEAPAAASQSGGPVAGAEGQVQALPDEKDLKGQELELSAGFAIKSVSVKEYFYTQLNVIPYYISLLLIPVNQNLDYDFPLSKSLFEVPHVREGTVLNYKIPPPIVSLILLLVIIGGGIYLFFRYGRGGEAGGEEVERSSGLLISYSIMWFFIILSPSSSFVPILDLVFEHRLYLPSLGFFVIFVLAVERLGSYLGGLVAPK